MRRWGIPLAIVAAVAAAEVAVLALRPREGVIAPAPVSVEAYFSRAELDRAEDFRGPQLWLYGGTLAIQVGVLALAVAKAPRPLPRRPVLGAVAAGAALSVALALAPLPVRAVMRERAKDVGLVTQSWPGWIQDVALSTAIGAGFAGVGAGAGVWLVRRFPRGWWLPASAVVVLFGAGTVVASPVVLDPLFNRFEELPEGRTRDDVLELARRAGVDVGDVLVMDASRRTTAANAYVTGLGRTKRVVLYDTLLESFDPDEVRLVVAHELAHVHYRDVRGGLLFLVVVAPAGMLAARTILRRIDPSPTPSVPALAASVLLVAAPITVVSNQLSREVEARADSYSLRLTQEPRTFIRFEQGIARRNVSDPDPPRLRTWLLGTHPPTIERIGIGVAFDRAASKAP